MNTNEKAGAWILPNKLCSRMEKLLPRYVSNLQRSPAGGSSEHRQGHFLCSSNRLSRMESLGWKVWGHTNEFWTMRVGGHQGIFRGKDWKGKIGATPTSFGQCESGDTKAFFVKALFALFLLSGKTRSLNC